MNRKYNVIVLGLLVGEIIMLSLGTTQEQVNVNVFQGNQLFDTVPTYPTKLCIVLCPD